MRLEHDAQLLTVKEKRYYYTESDFTMEMFL